MYYKPTNNKYPYTVEYEYEETLNSLIEYPAWFPLRGDETSVEYSEFQLIVPNNIKFRYKENNLTEKVKIKNNQDKSVYSWKITNLKAIENEPYSPNSITYLPNVISVPYQFEYDGYKGSFETWNDYGKWYWKIMEGRDELPEKTKEEIKAKVSGLTETRDKIKAVYEYMQNKTRYVAIFYGIGGLQPFKASDVDKNGYGDCKALSNYTRALLKAVDIKSYYTIIYGGKNPNYIDADFPHDNFNHVTLCVPDKNDTIWLECTSQTNPFGYTGTFTSDRKALTICENGGYLVHTNIYPKEKNLQTSKATVIINEDGNATAEVTYKYEGINYNYFNSILGLEKEEQKKKLYKIMDIPNFEINNFTITNDKSWNPSINEKVNITMKNYASLTNQRFFLNLNLLSKLSNLPKKPKGRKTDVELDYSFIDCDTVVYNYPSSYKVEFVPQNVELNTPFGSYSAKVIETDKTITYIRSYSLNKGKFPASKYEEFFQFLKAVANNDEAKAVLIRK